MITDNCIIVGKFGRPHGIKGYVTVHSFTEPRENILQYTNWQMLNQKKWQPLQLLDIEVTNKSILVMVKGYETRELSAHLTNIEIAVSSSQLPTLPKGQYYWHQLVGMQVHNTEGHHFGEVKEVMATGSNDVLIVQGTKRVLIPYLLDEFILEIDETAGTITVNWDADF